MPSLRAHVAVLAVCPLTHELDCIDLQVIYASFILSGRLCRSNRMLEAEGRVMHTECLHIKLHLDTLQAHPETPAIQFHGKATKTSLWIERGLFSDCRSPAKESAAGQKCRRITFAELDDIVYNQLKLPLYHLDMIGIQKVILS